MIRLDVIQLLQNHGLLTHKEHPQWYSVEGGSRVYVEKLRAAMVRRGVVLRTGCPVRAIRRDATGAELCADGAWGRFDAVVLAVHSDQALKLLQDASAQERATLGAIRFQPNTAVLHADPRLMPRRKAAWAAWNHIGATDRRQAPVTLTYWMNALQVSIPRDDPLFVTLNPDRPVDPALEHDRHVFHHPSYDHASVAAREAIRAANGARNTWFCGAWLQNGFHEDGINSAHEVARGMASPGVKAS